LGLTTGGAAALFGGGGDVRAEIRGLRLQELQWRLLNARIEHALQQRTRQVMDMLL
jgi:hypothetical protein